MQIPQNCLLLSSRSQNPVRWVSGLNQQFAKLPYGLSYRGFESPPHRRRPPSDCRKGAFCGEGGMLAEASSCLPLQTSPWGRLSRFAPKPAAHFTVHNGSKPRDSVPLRNPPAECAASTGLLKRSGLSDPSHNGSKSRNSVPLRNPPADCAASPGLLKRGGLSDPCHNGSKTRDSVPLRNPRPGRLLDVRMTAPTFPTFSTAFACGTWFAIGESDYICRAIK